MKRKVTYAHGAVESRRNTMFVRLVCILLSVTLLLCGCTQNATEANTISTTNTTEATTDTTPQDPFLLLKEWLAKDCSFTLSYQYTNLAINGMSQETTQTFAADGCWSFKNQRKLWDHTTSYESEENAEFYYCYEDSQFVCYRVLNGNAPERAVLNDNDRKAIHDSAAYLIGVPGLLPDYLQNLSVADTADASIFTYVLPVEKVLADSTLLSVFIQNVFSLANYEYRPETNLLIYCTFEANPETFKPISLSFDFSQLKTYVLSNGAQSGEFALGVDFMTMVYTFDYNLPPTIAIPENLIP